MNESAPQPSPQTQPPKPNLTLPIRFRESSFRFYEHVIAAAVSAHPGFITIDCSIYLRSPETFACRFRDAMRSFLDYEWDSKVIPREKFLMIHRDISVFPKRGVTLLDIGAKSSIKAADPTRGTPPGTIIRDNGTIANLPPIDLTIHTSATLLCLLASSRLLVQEVRTINFPIHLKPALESNYDVSIETDPNVTPNVTSVL